MTKQEIKTKLNNNEVIVLYTRGKYHHCYKRKFNYSEKETQKAIKENRPLYFGAFKSHGKRTSKIHKNNLSFMELEQLIDLIHKFSNCIV